MYVQQRLQTEAGWGGEGKGEISFWTENYYQKKKNFSWNLKAEKADVS